MARGEKKTGFIGVRLEPDIMAELDRYADAEERPIAMMARILIREALEARKKAGKLPKKSGVHVVSPARDEKCKPMWWPSNRNPHGATPGSPKTSTAYSSSP